MEVTITKLVHACLLVETDGSKILIDPGIFTLQDERFDFSMVEGVDRILITHEHADHASVEIVAAALERSNDAQVETTDAMKDILAESNIDSATFGTPQFPAPHERLPTGPGPQNTGFHIAGVLSHPGDSHSFVETMPILAMPFASPWGSVVAAVDRTRLVNPRIVIPIHDWFWSLDGRDFMYGLVQAGLDGSDIELVVVDDFESVTFSV